MTDKQNGFPSIRRVYVVSPYSGATSPWWIRPFVRWQNVRFARKCMDDCFRYGEAPFVPHLLYTQIFNDDNSDERRLGCVMACVWLKQSHHLAVYLDRGITPGMRSEIAIAQAANITVEYRRLCL